MGSWAQLYWPVDRELPEGGENHQGTGEEADALSAEWETTYDELSRMYQEAAPSLEGYSLARWLSEIYYSVALSSDEVAALGIQPLMTCTEWDYIEDEGAFPDFPEDWAAPGDVEKACGNLLGLLNDSDEAALKAREIYVKGRLSADDPRHADESWRKEREQEFEAELRQIAENAAKCREQGIAKVGFLIYR